MGSGQTLFWTCLQISKIPERIRLFPSNRMESSRIFIGMQKHPTKQASQCPASNPVSPGLQEAEKGEHLPAANKPELALMLERADDVKQLLELCPVCSVSKAERTDYQQPPPQTRYRRSAGEEGRQKRGGAAPAGDVLHVGQGVLHPPLPRAQDNAVEVGVDDRRPQALKLGDEPVDQVQNQRSGLSRASQKAREERADGPEKPF